MSIPNSRVTPWEWIKWILQHPGHPDYHHLEYATRYGKWRQGGMVGLEPKYAKPDSVPRRLVWNPVMTEIQAAQEVFGKFIGEGMLAYRVRADGSFGRRIVNFDPTSEEVIFVVGG